jgi:GntR family transcriptional regulator, transcriptional repressor for pyruvate dehydrogenase complex
VSTPSLKGQLTAIRVAKPADLIIRQIRNLIADGTLKPGDRLPSERELAQQFAIGRGYVREALRKLEFYGVLQTFPQSGTEVASLGRAALEQLISNLLALDRDDLRALTETRNVLEMSAAQLAAERATPSGIANVRAALDAYKAEIDAGRPGIEEDHLFHLSIANAAQNPIMASLIGLITPDVIRLNHAARACEGGRAQQALLEHEQLFEAIARHDVAAAVQAMGEHMRMTRQQYAGVEAPRRAAVRARVRGTRRH